MLTRLRIRNFKTLAEADIELGQNVVFIGPNNSGKTTALQALALWKIAIVALSRTEGEEAILNIRDLVSVPVQDSRALWYRKKPSSDLQDMVIEVDGVHGETRWISSVVIAWANEQTVRVSHAGEIPQQLIAGPVTFLAPLGGVTLTEPLLQPGRVEVLLGEGQTGQVIRNICYRLTEQGRHWTNLAEHMHKLFGVRLRKPVYFAARGEILLSYQDANDVEHDITALGRGALQTLLLLAHLYAHPGSVLLLDEPDAHLEVLRQRENYRLITEVAAEVGSQIIAASHSEVIMEEAAQKDVLVAFVGTPHRINDQRMSEVRKALTKFGYDQYYQAEETGWVLYLEGATDLAILQKLAARLNHPAARDLEKPFVKYTTDLPQLAREHFFALREAKPDLVGCAIFDRLDSISDAGALRIACWSRYEMENYIATPEVLLAYAQHADHGEGRVDAMKQSIDAVVSAAKVFKEDPFGRDAKASRHLDAIFDSYFEKLGLPNLLRKTNYHILADFVNAEQLDAEISEKLDLIHAVAHAAQPRH